MALDGMLRGWPFSTGNESTAREIDDALRIGIPVLLIGMLRPAELGGVDLSDPPRLAGVMGRSNVFYRIEVSKSGSMTVTPTYVVLGPYEEVWDPEKQRITIEAQDWSRGGADMTDLALLVRGEEGGVEQ